MNEKPMLWTQFFRSLPFVKVYVAILLVRDQVNQYMMMVLANPLICYGTKNVSKIKSLRHL